MNQTNQELCAAIDRIDQLIQEVGGIIGSAGNIQRALYKLQGQLYKALDTDEMKEEN